jgi:phosphatidylinositol alpha-1,6-mannosyltransferase
MLASDPALAIPSTVVLTGHFPPEPGGVQTFVYELARRLPADRIQVVAPHHPDARRFDETLQFPVHRRRGYLLTQQLRRVVQESGATAGWITAAAPFGLFAPALRRAGVSHIVASSHGQEMGWLRVAPTRWALRGVLSSVDVFTCLTPTTRRAMARVLRPADAVAQLHGGVDTERFHPDAGRDLVRSMLELGDRPVVVSVSRLVRRKGHDVLLRAWPEVLRRVPYAVLLIVGSGPMEGRLRRRGSAPDVDGSVLVTGPVAAAEVAGYLAAGDVFVLPCRDARGGLQAEGLGLAVLEAAAVGLPVVVGRSGGSAEALVDGRTGRLVDSRRPEPLAEALADLLTGRSRARSMGEQGRRWIEGEWTWQAAALQLAALLRGTPGVSDATASRPAESDLDRRP